MINILLLILINIALSFLLIKYRFVISKTFNLLDKPKKNKIHNETVPIIGGLLIMLGFISNLIFLEVINIENEIMNITLILSLFAIGFLDDMKNLKPNTKLLICTGVVLFLTIQDKQLHINHLNFFFLDKLIFFNKNYIEILIPTLCILLLINAYNMSDGINGLAGMSALSWFFYIMIKDILLSKYFVIIIIFIFLYLFLNFRNNAFLGDGGNYLISGIIASTLIKLNFIFPQKFFAEEIFLILSIPGIDMFRLFCVRIYKMKNPFRGDLDHFHHILLREYNIKKTLLIYMALINVPLYAFYYLNDYLLVIILIQIIGYFFLINKKVLKKK
jgi:UDP-GlcNAc:undecaprenyl-phosphate GlcNAc-1-phosphate transferase